MTDGDQFDDVPAGWRVLAPERECIMHQGDPCLRCGDSGKAWARDVVLAWMRYDEEQA